MRKIVLLLLASLLFLNSCAALPNSGVPGTETTAEGQDMTSKEPESSDMPDDTEPAVTEPAQTEPLAAEPQAKDILVCNTLTPPLVMLPYHDADNIPNDFFLAMQDNPIDRDYREACWNEPRMSSTGVASEYLSYYEAIWKTEIDQTIDQIVAYWGENSRSSLEKYAELSLAQTNALAIQYNLFYNEQINMGRYMVALAGLSQSTDVCRNTAFMLKYFLYLTECHENGKAEQSLQFSFETDASHEYDEDYIPVPRGTCLIPLTLSPSYSYEYGEAFSEQMKECLAQEHNLAFWKNVMIDEMENLYPLCREITFVRYCSDYFAFCAQQWILEDELEYRGLITLSQEQIDSRMWVAVRQLAMKLQYWHYLLDTEPRLPEF